MTTMFDTNVRIRRNHTPWARMALPAFMKEMAMNIPWPMGSFDSEVTLKCHYRKNVASSFWWTIEWRGEDGERHQAEAQELDLCLWRAAEIEMEIRAEMKKKGEICNPVADQEGNREAKIDVLGP